MARLPKHRSRGFTLVELLVAIMILTLFMTASMGAVRIASRSWAAGQERTDTTEELRAVSDFLRRQFAQLPLSTVGEGRDERLLFAASETNVMFVAPATQFSHGAGLMTYLLAAEEDGERQMLTLRYAPFDPGSETVDREAFSAPMVLASGFDKVGFQYYGAPTEDDDLSWWPLWQEDAEQLPRAIIIRTREEGETSGWPDLVFALRSGEAS